MKHSFSRRALGLCVAAVLFAGCGGAQAPVVVPASTRLQGSMRSSTRTALQSPAYQVKAPLLYVTNSTVTDDDVRVYRALANDPTPLATISDDVEDPTGACIDGQGTLYVTNEPASGPGWISEYPLGKTAASEIVKDGIDTPAFCAIDAKGNLWVTNIFGPNVTEYLAGSKKPHTVITDGLTFPIGIAFDHSGNLYVGNGWDASQQNVEVYAPGTTSPSRTITDGVTWPVGIAVDSKGTLYVTNTEQDNVEEYRYGQDYPFQTITKAMNSPVGVTVNKKGLLYVANLDNTVVEFAPGSLEPLGRKITNGLYDPEGMAYYPALLP